jgi:hypothetical protein
MTRTREAFFECSFTSGEASRTAHLRAWSAAEAEELFREVLAEEGVRADGRIVVTPRPAHIPSVSIAAAGMHRPH